MEAFHQKQSLFYISRNLLVRCFHSGSMPIAHVAHAGHIPTSTCLLAPQAETLRLLPVEADLCRPTRNYRGMNAAFQRLRLWLWLLFIQAERAPTQANTAICYETL